MTIYKVNRCKLHKLIKMPCHICTGVDEHAGANYYPPIKFKSLEKVLDELRISKETGAFSGDQDFDSMLNDIRNSMVDGYEAIKSDLRDLRQMQILKKKGW